MKRFLATLMVVAMMISTMVVGTVPAAAVEADDAASKYVTLDGEWNFKIYRTYSTQYQSLNAGNAEGTTIEPGLVELPSADVWSEWETYQFPNNDISTGGLMTSETFPKWNEAWAIRTFELDADFTQDETVTLLMGIIDDADVIYINGTPVASSGFMDGNGNKIVNTLPDGGFDYTAENPEDQVKFEKSYWEVRREYTIPADVLNLGGTNEIAVRVFNNNSNGGFYAGNLYALCGNEIAYRNLKGMPIEKAESDEVLETVAAQQAAIASGDIDAFAATVAENYHNDADDKADKVAEAEALIAQGATFADDKVAMYIDDEGNYWYSAKRTTTVGENSTTETVELSFAVSGGEALERGNWNRCYGTGYASELFKQNLTYSVYLPPSYYTNTDKEYPVVWLLHGQNSSSTSYRDVDKIGAFMDEQIKSGNIVEMVLIMPDSGKNAFYRDSSLPLPSYKDYMGPWRTQLTVELRAEAQANYRIMKDARFNGLTGNSMGAYGSIMAGTIRPDLYSSIGLHMGFLPNDALESLKSLTPEQLDAFDIYLDCGLQDQTVGTDGTIAIHDYLESVGKEHGYDLRDGTHGSAFYMEGMDDSMKMHSDHFKANGLLDNEDPSMVIDLTGEWNFKIYRTYSAQYQSLNAGNAEGTTVEPELVELPSADVWSEWETYQFPNNDISTGGLMTPDTFPKWNEAWAIRNFELPRNFTIDETVTLLMGIIDDADVIYINGTPVASSGFMDGNGNKIVNTLPDGGFDYTAENPEDQVKFEKSYWEVKREYTIPADVLNLGGTNEIAVRVFNNNSNGGFYAGNLYALCGNEIAYRNLKGMPIEKAESDEVMAVVKAQIDAIEAGDIDAFAATVAENYHNDADTKADRVADVAAEIEKIADYTVNVEDADVVIYKDDEGNYWYSAQRTIYVGEEYSEVREIELCYTVSGGQALERGNWNRCYGTGYASELFKQNLTYSVYLPPSYYTNTDKEYPVVWLLHGQNSSSTSYRDVDKIGTFMDEQIASGNIVEMVLIMPDSGKNAFYRDSNLSIPAYKDYMGPWRTQLTEELRGVAQEAYRIKKEAKFNGLTGNSMGAYGSIMAGTTRPDLYSSIGLHMGFLPNDALESLKALTPEQLAAYDFYLDCGLQDQTVGTGGTIAIHDYLESVGKSHGYDLRDGTHGSAFYMEGMPASMKMHSDHFLANGLPITVVAGGGGGGSAALTNSVSVAETENGTVTRSPKSAAEGVEVKLTVTPDEGYELADLTVTDAKGNEVEVELKNGKYVFKMPASKVTVSAEFAPVAHADDCASLDFSDLNTEAWYHEAVDYVLDNGMMAGVADGKFAPAMNLTRGMVVQILWAMESKPAVSAELTFEDVAADAWYAQAVRWAAAEGIVSGYSAEAFGPADAVTREQMAVMLSGYARYKGVDVAENAVELDYVDADSASAWAVAGLKWACGEGILSGKSGNMLDPTGTATRMEAAQMLMKFSAVLAD